MPYNDSDTIAAIATPPGSGGIAVLRISGARAHTVLSALFRPARHAVDGGSERSFSFRPRFMHYGHALDAQGELLDEVLAVFLPGPGSSTGEDTAEIHSHGGNGVTTVLLDAALVAGARLAAPGEFTLRAFLNGRMDLTRAEAVAEIVNAPTREGVRLAAAKLGGALSREVNTIASSLDDLRMRVTLCVDFPDEGIDLIPREEFASRLGEVQGAVARLLAAFERARLWREGAMVVLAGRVNAGKSSLFNALLGRERAIVADVPGTTRDYIEESLCIKGLPVRLVDTAGLREGGGVVEREGILRSRDLATEADCLVFVAVAGHPLRKDERDFLLDNTKAMQKGRLFLVLNKSDLLPGHSSGNSRPQDHPEVFGALAEAGGAVAGRPCYALSARTGAGLDAFVQGMGDALLCTGDAAQGGPVSDIAPNLRQAHLLREAGRELDALAVALAEDLPEDMLGAHLEATARLLDEVTGGAGNEELLERIFSTFCIGK